MGTPTINSIVLGLAFIAVGLVKVLCDRWQMKVSVIGKGTRIHHVFDHIFLLWFIKQLLQVAMLPLWKAIDSNFLMFGVCKHGDAQPRARGRYPVNLRHANNDRDNTVAIEDERQDGEDQQVNDQEGEEEPLLNPRPKKKSKRPSVFMYLPPALFSLAHVMLLHFGLKLTYSSSFIMLKGTVAFFTALLSMAFLAQQLPCYVWFGVIVATLGFGVSGISDYIHNPDDPYEKYGIAAGDLLIVMSQIMFATRIIYEEKFIRKYSIHPMKFLGCEGVYGISFALCLLLVANFVDAVQYSSLPNQKLEDVVDAWLQACHSWKVSLAVVGSIFGFIIYSYLGMFLIRDHGALPRIMIETLFWAIYWAVCLALGWENFFIAQVPGLCVIAIGVLIYSHILVIPCVSRDNIPREGGYGIPIPVNNGDGRHNQDNNNERDSSEGEDDDEPVLGAEGGLVNIQNGHPQERNDGDDAIVEA